MPMNAATQSLALSAAARFHNQIRTLRQAAIFFIVAHFTQAVIRKLLWKMAFLTRISRWTHGAGMDWKLILLRNRQQNVA